MFAGSQEQGEIRMGKFLKIATLSDADKAKIRRVEEETGTHIMAFEPALKVADLDDENLQKIRVLEGQIGATLLVFESASS
jgi:hypothetical protein